MAARRIGLVAALLVATVVLWLIVEDAAVGISFLFLAPILAAAAWYGRRGGLATGLAAGVLFGLAGVVVDEPHLLAGALIRGAIYTGLGYLVGMLFEQSLQLRGEVAAQQRELAELRAIQEALVPPRPPERPSLDLASCYVPAQEGVAGDFYIVAEGPRGASIVVVGDVVGKGLQAARRASFVRTAFATFAPFTDDPVRLLEMANYSLIEKAGTSQEFVTAACLTFQPQEHRMAWALAGHPPPMRLDDGTLLDDVEPGIPLGMDVDLGCRAHEATLAQGAGVLLYTDGLVEARRPGNGADLLGVERVSELLGSLSGQPPGEVVQRLRAAAEDFAGGELADDLCMVALRATAGAAAEARPAASRPGARPPRRG